MYLSYFFNSMLVPSDILIKTEKSKVRFDDEEEAYESSAQKYSVVSKTVDPYTVLLSNKKSKSFDFIVQFSKLLCENISENCDLYYLNLLIEILGSAANEELLFELMNTMVQSDSRTELPLQFVNSYVLKWIDRAKNDSAKLNNITELIFIMCSNVKSSDAMNILNSCSELKNLMLLHSMLNKGLTKCKDDILFQDWIKNPIFSSNIIRDLQDIMNKLPLDEQINPQDCNTLLSIFYMCLDTKVSEKPLIDDKSMDMIMISLKELTEAMFNLEVESKNFICGLNFLCDICVCILNHSKICWNFKSTEEIVSSIFHKSLSSYDNSSYQNLTNVWVAAIESYIHIKSEIVHDNSVILSMASQLHTFILSSATLNEAYHVLNHCLGLLSTVQESLIIHKSKLQYSALFALYKLMDLILPLEQNWFELRTGFNHSTVPLFLKKKLFYPLLVEESFFPFGDTKKLFLITHIVTKIILNELQRSNSLADDKFCESFVNKHFPHILWFTTFFEESSAAKMLGEELSSIKLSDDCFKMLSFLPNGINDIVNEIFESCLFYGTYWSVPLQFLIEHYDQIAPQTIPLLIANLLEKEDLSQNLNKYALQEMTIPYLPYEKQMTKLQTVFFEISRIQDLSNDHFAGKLGEICCYLQNDNIKLTPEMQIKIREIICKVIDYNFANENLKFAHDLQITSALTLITKYGLSVLSQKILNHFMSTLNNFLKKSFTTKLINPTTTLELYQACLIFIAITNFCYIVQSTEECTNEEDLPLFDDLLYKDMICAYLHAANVFNQFKCLPDVCSHILVTLSEAMVFHPTKPLVRNIDELTEIPGLESSTILQSLVSSLTFSVRQIQFTSHSLLLKVMRRFPKLQHFEHKIPNEDDSDEEIERIPNCLSPLIKLLTFLTDIIESMLLEFKIGDLCSVRPQTDSYVYTMAYLLAWIEMLEFISSSPSQIRTSYATQLEEKNLLTQLFSNVFRLMPSNPMMCLKKGLNLDTPKKEDLKLLFIHSPVLNAESSSSEDIQSIASYVYATVLRKVPASIRTWWNNLDRKSADIVNKFTTKYISGILCIEEIQAVHESETQFENMTVQARPGSREVIATYTIDDCAIELSVQLPVNYPLGPISAERRGKIVIGQLEWRHWLMQLTTVLRYQNGSILDGLNIWKRNLDKKFEGVEECMICYYILHSSTLKLPKLSCRVCKKKFHSACLYKWFDTSYNSTCPLCRNEFFIPMQKL